MDLLKLDTLSLFLLLLCLQWFQNGNAKLSTILSTKGTSISVNPCLCHKSCPQHSTSEITGTISFQLPYFYDTKLGACVQLSSLCAVNASCAFGTEVECASICGASRGDKGATKRTGCNATKFGCCPNGSPRFHNGSCPPSVDSASGGPSSPSSHSSYEVRWDLVATGVVVLVLLVAVLSISGIMAYHFKEKQKERVRSRYIRNVLEMYDSESDSSASGPEGAPAKADTGTERNNAGPLFAKV